jgi:hypothetical protein
MHLRFSERGGHGLGFCIHEAQSIDCSQTMGLPVRCATRVACRIPYMGPNVLFCSPRRGPNVIFRETKHHWNGEPTHCCPTWDQVSYSAHQLWDQISYSVCQGRAPALLAASQLTPNMKPRSTEPMLPHSTAHRKNKTSNASAAGDDCA